MNVEEYTRYSQEEEISEVQEDDQSQNRKIKNYSGPAEEVDYEEDIHSQD